MKEWAGGTDLAFEETETFGLGPVFPLRGVHAGCRKQLSDGSVVEGGVLADVEDGEVESEGAQDASDRVDVVVGESCGAGFAERAVERLEVFVEFGRTTVPAWGIADLGELAWVEFHGQPCGEEFRGLTPGFAGMHLEDQACFIAEGGDGAVPEFHEAGRRGLDPFGEGEAFGEAAELAMEDDEGVGAETFQGLCRDFRGDTGMPVPVAADPCPEAQSGTAGVGGQGSWIQSGASPGNAQASVEFGDDAGQDVAEVVEDVAAFIRDGWLLEEDLPGAPESFEQGGEFAACCTAIRAGSRSLEQLHQRAMLLQDGRALGLGGMGGEDGFDLHVAEDGRDGIRRGTGRQKAGELVGPQAALGLGAFRGLTQVPHGFRGVFLNGIEKLECDGQAQPESGGRSLVRKAGEAVGFPPRDPGREFRFTEAVQHLRQAVRQPPDVPVDLLESELDVVRCGQR